MNKYIVVSDQKLLFPQFFINFGHLKLGCGLWIQVRVIYLIRTFESISVPVPLIRKPLTSVPSSHDFLKLMSQFDLHKVITYCNFAIFVTLEELFLFLHIFIFPILGPGNLKSKIQKNTDSILSIFLYQLCSTHVPISVIIIFSCFFCTGGDGTSGSVQTVQ